MQPPRVVIFPNGVLIIYISGGNATRSDASWPTFRHTTEEEIDKLERKMRINERKAMSRFEQIQSKLLISNDVEIFPSIHQQIADWNGNKTDDNEEMNGGMEILNIMM